MKQSEDAGYLRSDMKAADGGEPWLPQASFAHIVEGERGIEEINARGRIAVAFTSLPKTPFHVTFSGSTRAELSIWKTETRYGFRTIPRTSADLIVFRFVSSGFITRYDDDSTEHFVGYDRALLAPFHAMGAEQMSADFSSITVAIASERITEACSMLTGRVVGKIPQFQPVVAVDSVGLATLKATAANLLVRLAKDVDHHDLMTPLMQEILAYQLISTWPTIDGRFEQSVANRSDQAIGAAIDFIEVNLARKISISDIAKASGLSIRTLQIGFKERFGYSPVQHLIARRLDQVHSTLQHSSDDNVRWIASQWGFTHMSDFGRRYRQRFGVSPNQGRRK